MQSPEEYKFFQETLNGYLQSDINSGYIDRLKAAHCPPQYNLMLGRFVAPPADEPYDLFRVMRNLRPNGKLTPLVYKHAYKEFSAFTQLAKAYVF